MKKMEQQQQQVGEKKPLKLMMGSADANWIGASDDDDSKRKNSKLKLKLKLK